MSLRKVSSDLHSKNEAELISKLQEQLKKDASESSEIEYPYIVEEELPSLSGSLAVGLVRKESVHDPKGVAGLKRVRSYVIWDEWKKFNPEDRSRLIHAAYRSSDHRDEPFLLAFAKGLTIEEVEDEGLADFIFPS